MEWEDFIREEMKEDYFKCLSKFLSFEEKIYKIYPAKDRVFNAFKECSFENTKVIILAQDPYINPGQAQGMSFSVPDKFPLPPSLLNIFKELHSDLGIPISKAGNLTPWANQGVLLLNSVLTVREGISNSHRSKGWEQFTDKVIKKLNDEKIGLVFILWGSFARSKKSLITNQSHLVLECGHPSPLSCKLYFGNKHFSKTNEFLLKNNISPIDWKL